MDLHWPLTVPVMKLSETQHAVTPGSEASIYLAHVLVRPQEAFTSECTTCYVALLLIKDVGQFTPDFCTQNKKFNSINQDYLEIFKCSGIPFFKLLDQFKEQTGDQASCFVCVCVQYFIYLVVLGVSFGTQAVLRHVGSQILDQGSNTCPLDCKADFKPLDHQGSPLFCFFVFLKNICLLFVTKII